MSPPGTLCSIARFTAWAVVLFGAYSAVFVALYPTMGRQLGTVQLFPLIVLGWRCGVRAGVVAAVAMIGWHFGALFPLVGLAPEEAVARGGWLGMLAVIILAALAGWVGGLYRQLRASQTELQRLFEERRAEHLGREREWKESEQRYSMLVHTLKGIVWEADAATFQFTFVSPQAERILGYPAQQWIEQADFWVAHTHPDDVSWSAAFCKSATARGEDHEFEYRMIASDGRIVWLRDIVTVNGCSGRLSGIMVDITERKQAEAALRESEARLNEAQRVGKFGSWTWETPGRALWSRTLCELFDLPVGEPPTYEQFLSRVAEEDRARVGAEWQAFLCSERTELMLEYRLAGEPGQPRMVVACGRAERGPDGGLLRVVGTVQDVTERKLAEQALRDSHALLNAIIEGTSDAVFLKDLQGRYLMINSAGARFIGKPVAEVLGQVDLTLFPPDTARHIQECDRLVMATGEPHEFEETVVAAGLTRQLLAIKAPYRDAQGKVIGLIGIAHDVTEMKRLEEQFRQSQKMEAIGRLAGGVAHDFNNLLTVINGYTEMAVSGLRSDDPTRELLEEVQQAGQRATILTRQLLAFSRKQVLQPREVCLNALLEGLCKMLRSLIGEDIELVLRLAPSAALVRVDPGQFEQVITNLAVNARHAMPAGGRLTIATQGAELDEAYAWHDSEAQPGAYVRVTVTDTGCGMDEATRARVFEPFFTTKGPGEGTGLGLAMVYGFVKQSGGHIEVISRPGEGATFELYLPSAAPTEPPLATLSALKAAPGNETVLLVEDEDAVRSLARMALQSNGYRVLEAPEGQTALEVARRYDGPIHLLLTDLVMPRMSGRQLADQLAQQRPEVRALFMSGYTDEAVARHGILEGSVAFLQKPFTPVDLARKVREVLDAVAPSAQYTTP